MKYLKPSLSLAQTLVFLMLAFALNSAQAQTCPPVSNIQLTQPTSSTQLSLTWTANSTALGFEVVYRTNLGQAIYNTPNSNITIARNIQANYEIISIRAICSGGVKSSVRSVAVEGVIIVADEIWKKVPSCGGTDPMYLHVIIQDVLIFGGLECVKTTVEALSTIETCHPHGAPEDVVVWSGEIEGLLGRDDTEPIGPVCPEDVLAMYGARFSTPALLSLDWTIAPNPFSDYVTISAQLEAEQTTEIQIVDLMGRKVLSTQLKETAYGQYESKLNTSSLTPGVYQVILRTATGMQAKKMIKQ